MSARFFIHRGLAQMRIESPADLEHIADLDAARWSATSVPNEQLFADPAFLAAVDSDKSNRIRRHEVLAAIEWLKPRLKERARMFGTPSDAVRLADLDVTHPDVANIVMLATQRFGKGEGKGDEVALAEIRAFAESYKKKMPNGDGVVPADQIIDSVELAAFVKSIVESIGGALDVSGELGVNAKKLDELVARAKEWRDWSSARTWTNAHAEACAAVLALESKIEQFFAQCDLVGQESAASARVMASLEELAALDVSDAVLVRAFLAKAPPARAHADAVLDASGWLNPVYASAVRALFAQPLSLLLGVERVSRMSRDEWSKVKDAVAPYRAHELKKPVALDAALHTISDDDDRVRLLRKLCSDDETASKEIDALATLERIALMQRWLVELTNNMVSFPSLFRSQGRALFQAGTLILDGRELSFCVRAPDIASHRPVAEKSNLFVVYAELERKEGDVTKKQQIAAAVTSGQRRGIGVGKRGVFYDRDGKEHDARVLDIIERPISLYEAAVAPFVRVRDVVLGFIEKTSAGKLDAMEKKAHEGAATGVSTATTVAATAASAPPPVVIAAPAATSVVTPAPKSDPLGGIGGKLVGGGVAIAALGSGAAFMLQTIAGISLIDALAAIASVCVGIALLAGFLGWLKLRRRDLSTMLEACGWAFNARIYLNRRHALRFTRVPPLPKGSTREQVLLPAIAAESDDGTSGGMLVFALIGALLAAAVAFREPLLKLLMP